MTKILFKLQFICHNFSYKAVLIKIFILATAMALIPCLDLIPSIDSANRSLTFENAKHRMSPSDLEITFRELMAGNLLINGYKALSIGRDSASAVMVLKKLGFLDAIGLYRSCWALFHRRNVHGLPFKEESFDFVISTEMIDGVRVPARLVLEMERLLRPGRVGVVLRRLTGRFPATALMKAAAPVSSFLRFSSVVGVRMINGTVVVVFEKRVAVEDPDPVGPQRRLVYENAHTSG